MTDLSQLSYSQRRASPVPLSPEGEELAALIAQTLNEHAVMPQKLIRSLIYFCGVDTVRACYEETLRVEAEGGLMVNSGKRRRTPGGTFFYLMQQRVTPEIRRWTFVTFRPGKGKKDKPDASSKSKKSQKGAAKTDSLDWSQLVAISARLQEQVGVATTVKITLIGRPGAAQIQNQTVITTMEHIVKASSLPKGVPTPPRTPTRYTIFIGLKQWNKVRTVLEDDPEDVLIIEGVTTFDPELNGMAVFASGVTTKAMEIAKREAQKAKSAAEEKAEAPAADPPPAPTPQPPVSTSMPPDPPADDLPASIPPAERQKILDLQRAAQTYRQKLSALEENPPDERPGYEMTRKLLQSTETRLEALLKNYK